MYKWVVFLSLCCISSLAIAREGAGFESKVQQLEQGEWKDRSEVETMLQHVLPELGRASASQRHRINLIQAHLAMRSANYEKAERIASAIAKSSNSSYQKVVAYSLLTQLYTIQGRFEQAFTYMNKGEELASSDISERAKHKIYSVAGDLLTRADLLTEANLRIQRSMAVAEHAKNPSMLCVSLFVNASFHYAQNSRIRAQKILREQIAQCELSEDVVVEAVGRVLLGRLLTHLGEYGEAEMLLKSALSILDSQDYKSGIISAKIALTELYLARELPERVEPYLFSGLSQAMSLGHRHELSEFYHLAGIHSEMTEDLVSALKYERLRNEAADATLTKSDEMRLAYLKSYYSETAEQQKESLSHSAVELEKLRKEAVWQGRWLYIMALMMFCAVIGGVTALTIRSRREQRQYRKITQSDALTHVYNRPYALELAEGRYKNCQFNSIPFTVVMADVDHLKLINETFGYAVGDQVLRSIARQIMDIMGSKDIVGRTGGEEFSIFLPGKTEDDAKYLIEKCQKSLSVIKEKITHGVDITVSFGVARATTEVEPLHVLLKQSSEALKQAKVAGRNKIVIFSERDKRGDANSQVEVML